MKRAYRRVRQGFSLGARLLGRMALIACTAEAAHAVEADARVVHTLHPQKTTFQAQVRVTGDLKPALEAQLGFSVSGTLASVAVRRGQRVTPGQTLAVLDPALGRAAVMQAQASLEVARIQAYLAADALERLKAVPQAQGVSEVQRLQAQAQRDLTAAQVRAAQAQQAQAQIQLRFHTLRAPFEGVVIRIPEGTGMTVSAGMPLFGLEALHPLKLVTSVTPQEAAHLKQGSPVWLKAAWGDPRQEVQATLDMVLASADPITHRVPIEIKVPNLPHRLIPHVFAEAVIAQGDPQAALKIPASALVQKQGAFFVWQVPSDARVHAVRVQVLSNQGGYAVLAASPALSEVACMVDMPAEDLQEGTLLGPDRTGC